MGAAKNKKWIDLAITPNPGVRIPVCIQFQATIPDYTGPDPSPASNNPTTEKWLTEQTWPIPEAAPSISNPTIRPNTERKRRRLIEEIGKGWPTLCSCRPTNSIKCVERHVNDERKKLREELQSVYEKWKFDQMGDVVSESWSDQECESFELVLKNTANGSGGTVGAGDGDFMKEALKALPSKKRAEIVSYYMNVYLLNRISKEVRSGCEDIDTDEESDGQENGSSSRRASMYLSARR